MRGYKMVRAIMAEYKYGEEDFFRSKRRECVSARIDAMERLRDAGLNQCEIARIMRRDLSTVRYWLLPAMRAKKNGRRQPTRRNNCAGLKFVFDLSEQAATT